MTVTLGRNGSKTTCRRAALTSILAGTGVGGVVVVGGFDGKSVSSMLKIGPRSIFETGRLADGPLGVKGLVPACERETVVTGTPFRLGEWRNGSLFSGEAKPESSSVDPASAKERSDGTPLASRATIPSGGPKLGKATINATVKTTTAMKPPIIDRNAIRSE